MKTFARLDDDGFLAEVIPPVTDDDGQEVPIASRFHPSIVAALVEYDPVNPPPSRPQPQVDWRPMSVTAFKVTRDTLLAVVNDLMAQFAVMGQMDAARFCLGLIQPLRDAPADPTLQGATSAADYKNESIIMLRKLSAGSPDIVVAEFDRAIGNLK